VQVEANSKALVSCMLRNTNYEQLKA
jgi:hypothetical protein